MNEENFFYFFLTISFIIAVFIVAIFVFSLIENIENRWEFVGLFSLIIAILTSIIFDEFPDKEEYKNE